MKYQILGALAAMVLMFGLFKVMDHFVDKNYAMYKVEQPLEEWSEANEFEVSKLKSVAVIEKIGKSNYLVLYAYNGGYFETAFSFSYLNRRYKPVTAEQATKDIYEQWYPNHD
jgi:hypothetical protein